MVVVASQSWAWQARHQGTGKATTKAEPCRQPTLPCANQILAIQSLGLTKSASLSRNFNMELNQPMSLIFKSFELYVSVFKTLECNCKHPF